MVPPLLYILHLGSIFGTVIQFTSEPVLGAGARRCQSFSRFLMLDTHHPLDLCDLQGIIHTSDAQLKLNCKVGNCLLVGHRVSCLAPRVVVASLTEKKVV